MVNKGSELDHLSSSLIGYAKKKKKTLIKLSYKEIFFEVIERIYVPTFLNTVIVFLALSIVGLVFYGINILFFKISPQTYCKLDVFLTDITTGVSVTVHSGVCLVIFSIMIFIAEGLKKGSNDLGRVYLKFCLLYPLIVFELGVFIFMLISQSNMYRLQFILLSTLMVLFAVYRLLSVSLSKSMIRVQRIRLLKIQACQQIDESITQRLAVNHFFSLLRSGEILFKYQMDYRLSKKQFYKFKLNKTGYIKDIDIKKLHHLGALIEKEAERNGRVFAEEKVEMENAVIADLKLNDIPELRPDQKDDRRYVHVRLGDQILTDTNVISISKELFADNYDTSFLNSIVQEIFIIEEERWSLVKDLRLEVEEAKAELIDLLRSRRYKEFSDSYEVLYKTLIATFIKRMNVYGIKHDYEGAINEDKALFFDDGWDEIEWFEEDIKEFIENASDQKEDKKVLAAVLALPRELCLEGLEHREHLVFQKGLRLLTQAIYMFIEDSKSYGFKLSYQNYYYFLNYDLPKKLDMDDDSNLDDLSQADQGFYNVILNSISKLIVKFIKLENKEEYLVFLKLFNEVFGVKIIYYEDDIPKVSNSFVSRSLQFKFGLIAWVNKKFKSHKDKEIFLATRSLLQDLPSRFDLFLNLFIEFQTMDINKFWNWDTWDMDERGKFYTFSRLELTEEFGVARMAELIVQNNHDDNNAIILSKFEYLGSMEKTLAKIQTNFHEYKNIYPQITLEKIDIFQAVIAKAKEIKADSIRKMVIESKLSSRKIEEFIRNFYEEYFDLAVFRKIMTFRHKVDLLNKKNEPQNDLIIGINQVEDKEVFLEEPKTHYSNWWSGYAEGMANVENKIFIEQIKSQLEKKTVKKNLFIDDLKKISFEEGFAVFCGSEVFGILSQQQDYKYLASYRSDIWPEFNLRGWLTFGSIQVPIYIMPNLRNEALVIDFNKVPNLVQLEVRMPKGSKNLMSNFKHFKYNIDSFQDSETLMNELISKPPEWLKREGDTEQMKNSLLDQVSVRFFQNFVLETGAKSCGFNFVISEVVETDGAIE